MSYLLANLFERNTIQHLPPIDSVYCRIHDIRFFGKKTHDAARFFHLFRNAFTVCGQIQRIRLPRGSDGLPKGTAFVQFTTEEDVQRPFATAVEGSKTLRFVRFGSLFIPLLSFFF